MSVRERIITINLLNRIKDDPILAKKIIEKVEIKKGDIHNERNSIKST